MIRLRYLDGRSGEASTRDRYFDFARRLYDKCKSKGVPRDLTAYNAVCKIKDVGMERLTVDGCLYWLPEEDCYKVQINRALPPPFRRFVWAHEIAHTFSYIVDGISPSSDAIEERLGLYKGTRDNTERLCDEIAGELLMPSAVLEPLVGDLAPSLLSVIELSRLFDVSLTDAAFRFVQTVPLRCLLVLWEADFTGSPVLRPYARVRSLEGRVIGHIPPVSDADSQPIQALLTGRLQRGRSLIDLGGGKMRYYSESLASRRRSRRSVITLFVLEDFVEQKLQKPHKIANSQLRLFFP